MSFFRAFNSILSKVGRFASEEVVLSQFRSNCIPCLMYGVEACPFYARHKRSFDFTLTRTLMKLFRTGSAAIIKECQQYFNLLPLRFQVDIRTASFLEQFIVSTNSVCLLFKTHAQRNVQDIYLNYGSNVNSVGSLRVAINTLFASL